MNSKASKLLVIMPYMASYRVDVLRQLAKSWTVHVLTSDLDKSVGLGTHELAENIDHVIVDETFFIGNRLIWQRGVLTLFFSRKFDSVLITANPRYISFWVMLFVCRLKGVPCFSHGQGLYKKPSPSIIHRLIFTIIAVVSHRYICYSQGVKKSLLNIGIADQQLCVAENSLENEYPCLPESKTGVERGVLFLGRLRDECGVEALIHAAEEVKTKIFPELELFIVGGGPHFESYCERYDTLEWVNFTGPIFEQEKLAEISKLCRLGCYPGNAGLSVVHLLSLSLPVLLHNRLHEHGPECEYIKEGQNGWYFKHGEGSDFVKRLSEPFQPGFNARLYQQQAYGSYKDLTTPGLGDRLNQVFQNTINTVPEAETR